MTETVSENLEAMVNLHEGAGEIVLHEPGQYVTYWFTVDSVSVKYTPDGSNTPVRSFETEERPPTYC